MEKHLARFKLSKVKELVDAGRVHATVSATLTAARAGVHGIAAMCDVVRSLTIDNFYNSMPTDAAQKIWQNVYHCKVNEVVLHVGLIVDDDVLIVSFEEL